MNQRFNDPYTDKIGIKFSLQVFKYLCPKLISTLANVCYNLFFGSHNMFTSQIKLYDQRMVQRGAVQSYEGNVNSHTKIQLGVDPSENFVASGYSLKLM